MRRQLRRQADFCAELLRSLKEQGIIINDLFSLIIDKRDEYISPDGIHMNDRGKAVLADAVAEIIKKYI